MARPWAASGGYGQRLSPSEHEGASPPGNRAAVLFAFDPRRTAILLIGGNKQHRWREWYVEFIPVADSLYDEHLAELRREGELR